MSRRECRLAFFCSRLPSLLLLLLLSPSDVVGIDTALWCELTSPEVASERLPLASFLEDRLSKENEGIVLVLRQCAETASCTAIDRRGRGGPASWAAPKQHLGSV